MLDYISGQKGTGKTRILTETAVYTAEQSKGNIVFVEYGSKLSKFLPSLSDTSTLTITAYRQPNSFMAFCRTHAANYDLTTFLLTPQIARAFVKIQILTILLIF